MRNKIFSVFKQALIERCPPYFLIACVCIIVLVAAFEWMFPLFATYVIWVFTYLYPSIDWYDSPMLVLSTQLLYWLDKLTITLLGYTILSFSIDYLYPLALKRYHEFTKSPA